MTSLFRIFGANPTHKPPQPVQVRRRPWFETRAIPLLLLAMCLLLTGCATSTQTADREALSDTIGRAAVAGEQWAFVQDTIGSLRQHADPIVQAIAEIVNRVSERGKENTVAMQKRIRDVGKQVELLSLANVKKDARIAHLESQIIGPRGWLYLWILVGWWVLSKVLAVYPATAWFAPWISPVKWFTFLFGLFRRKSA